MSGDLIANNPMLKKPILAVLSASSQRRSMKRAELENEAMLIWSESYRVSPAGTIDALRRNGFLEERVLVNGLPYDGTLEDLQGDEAVPLDATVETVVEITPDGEALMRDYAPEATLQALFAQRPHYRNVFNAALVACAAAGGCARDEIEAAIGSAIEAGAITSPDGKRVYPQYFIDALETAGGIEWNGAWKATTVGLAAID